MQKRYAQRIGTYKGRAVYRVPVMAVFNDSTQCRTVAKVETTVISQSATEAANWLRDKYAGIPEAEFYAWGIKGGEVYRYIGWESALWQQLMASPAHAQLSLNF